jgi:hypothetical protein
VILGPAFTVRCRSDFLGVLQAVESAAPGEVVVVDGGGLAVALAGELFARGALARGLAGLVIGGGYRDIAYVARCLLPVYSRHVTAMAGTTGRLGELQVPPLNRWHDPWRRLDIDAEVVPLHGPSMPCRCTSDRRLSTSLIGRSVRAVVVAGPCDAGNVELTARMIEEIPRGNLRVPRSEFAAVWAEAERQCDADKRGGWYAAGVALTCRWIAGASVVFNLPHGPQTEPAAAPITDRTARAHEELIEAETLAAERMALKTPNVFDDRPGWVEAIAATFAWAWHGSGVPPLDVRRAQAG